MVCGCVMKFGIVGLGCVIFAGGNASLAPPPPASPSVTWACCDEPVLTPESVYYEIV
jgi:hypothetical protein